MGKERVMYKWWRLHQKDLPPYVTVEEPHELGAALKRKASAFTRRYGIQVLAVDDPFDGSAALEEERAPTTYACREGTVLLALPEDADEAAKSTPWPFRVDRLWLAPQDGGLAEPAVADASSAAGGWEQQQLAAGRVHARHIQLEVSFFYRLADLEELSEDKVAVLAASLAALGVVKGEAAGRKLVASYRDGTGEVARLMSRFLIYSTHVTRSKEEGADQEPDDAFSLEAAMAPAEVMFLGDGQPLPVDATSAIAAGALQACSAVLKRFKGGSRHAAVEAEQRQHQLAPGFVCNLMYVKQTDELLTLQDWGAGRGGEGLKGDWVARSRQQVKQLLRDTKQKLAALQPQPEPERQQQQQEAAAAAGGSGAAAAAAAAAAAEAPPASGKRGRQPGNKQQPSQTPAKRQRGQAASKADEQQQQQPDAADSGSSDSSSSGDDEEEEKEGGSGPGTTQAPPAAPAATTKAAATPNTRGSARSLAEVAMRTGKAVLKRLAGGSTPSAPAAGKQTDRRA